MSNTSDQTTQQSKTRLIIGEIGVDTETGIIGKGHSYDNGKTFTVDDTIYGRIYHADDHDKIWKGIQDQVAKVVYPAKSAADSAVNAADAAVASAQVTSATVSAVASATAEAKQGANEAMSRALSAWDVATGVKSAVTDFDPLLKSAQSDASIALTQIADTANALSDAKTAFGSDVATAKELASTAQTTADSAVAVASDARSNATVAIQTASGASLTATNAQSDATIAKQTASEAIVQASNADSDFAQISIRANKIEANVATNSGAIASVQQTANGLTTTVGKVDDRVKTIEDKTNWTTMTGPLDMNTLTTTQNIYYRDTNLTNSDGEAGWAYIQVVSTGERVTQTVWHDRSSIQHTRTGAVSGSSYNWDAWNKTATDAQVTQVKQTIDGIATTINDPKTGLNATYQTAAGNSSTISSVKGDVTQLQTTANGLTSRVGNLESKTDKQQTAIEQNKTAITLKADQTTVNTLKGTVDQNTATLKTQADQIQAKVSSSDVTGMLNGYATQSYTQSLVTQTADKWNLNLTSLKTDVNTIKTTGGGVNLANGTKSDDQSFGDASQTTGWRTPIIATFNNPQAGQQYTVSVNAKSNGGSWKMQVWDGTSTTQRAKNVYDSNSVISTQVQKITVTFTWPSGSNKYLLVQLVNNNDGGQIVWNSTMIEEGAVAHTWSPAPSDLATVKSVANLSATVNGIQSQVYNSDGSSKITQLSSLIQSKVSQGDYNSQITQLKNDINQRVQVGNVISQINQEAGGDTLIQVSNGKKSLILDAGNTIFTGKAWIPDAAISEINTDKLFFSDSNGNKSFMSTNLGALDPMAPANSLSIRYKTGYEVTTSDRGVFFMMGQNYTRYAVRSKYSDKFSGIWASDTEAFFIEEGQGLHLWAPDRDQSAWALYNSNNVGIRASLSNTNAIEMGKVDDGYAYNTKMDTSPTAIAFYVNGWEWVAGYVEAMGHTTHSVLSSKTRIEQADPEHMLDLINQTELTTFAYKSELADGTDHRHIGPIIDDINDVAQYQIPSEFVAPTKTARDDGNIVGALIGAVQSLTKRIKKLEDKLNE